MELANAKAIIMAGCAVGAGLALMIMGCAIAETTGIYGFVTGLLLMLLAPNLFISKL